MSYRSEKILLQGTTPHSTELGGIDYELRHILLRSILNFCILAFELNAQYANELFPYKSKRVLRHVRGETRNGGLMLHEETRKVCTTVYRQSADEDEELTSGAIIRDY